MYTWIRFKFKKNKFFFYKFVRGKLVMRESAEFKLEK